MSIKTYSHFLVVFVLGLTSCNTMVWNQNRLNKKLEKKDIIEQSFVTSESTIHYYKGGEGPKVLLLHGFGADAQVTWHKTMRKLSKNYTVIAPDLLWFGQSNSSMTPNLESQVRAMIALMNTSNIDKFSIAGISYGGFVTMAMYYTIPKRIEKICLIDSPGVTYDIEEMKILCKENDVEDIAGIFVVKEPEGVQKLMNLAFYKDKKIPKKILNQTYELYFSQHHKELTSLLRTLPAEQSRLLSIDIDTYPKSLVIWGIEDDVFPLKEGEKLAEHMGAEFFQIEKAGHAPNIEKFKIFQDKLESFLAD